LQRWFSGWLLTFLNFLVEDVGRCWKMLEDVNFFFVAACPWFSVPCERYILQTRVTVGSVLRQVTLLPSRPPLVKQFSGRQFFSPASWVLL